MEGSSNSFHWTRELILQTTDDHGLIQVTDTEERFKEGPEKLLFP